MGRYAGTLSVYENRNATEDCRNPAPPPKPPGQRFSQSRIVPTRSFIGTLPTGGPEGYRNDSLLAHVQHPAAKLTKSVILSGVPRTVVGELRRRFRRLGTELCSWVGKPDSSLLAPGDEDLYAPDRRDFRK